MHRSAYHHNGGRVENKMGQCLSTGGEILDSLPVGYSMIGEILLFVMKDGSNEGEGDNSANLQVFSRTVEVAVDAAGDWMKTSKEGVLRDNWMNAQSFGKPGKGKQGAVILEEDLIRR